LITLNFERALILFSFFFTLILFYIVTTSFARILITALQLILASVVLANYNLDFFSGFLLVAELPILLIASVFYFQKFGIKFDSLYNIKNINIVALTGLVGVLIVLIVFFTRLLNSSTIYSSSF
jgi:hypothetical protein